MATVGIKGLMVSWRSLRLAFRW